MARAGAAAALLLSCAPHAGAQDVRARDAADFVQREWRVREWALDGTARRAAFEPEIAAPQRFLERAELFEAVARGLRVGVVDGSEDAVRLAGRSVPLGALELDPRELVAALELVGAAHLGMRFTQCFGDPSEPPDPLGAESWWMPLVEHRLPSVRIALVGALGAQEHAGQSLLRLALDRDERVAQAARVEIFRRGEAAPQTLVALWRIELGLGPAAVLEFLQRLAWAHPSEALLDDLARESTQRTPRAVLEALRMRYHGVGDSAAIVEAWPGPARLGGTFLEAARAARTHGEQLGRALFARAELHGGAERLEALRGAGEALEPFTLLELALDSALEADERVVCWSLVRGRVERWDVARVAPWLDPRVDEALRLEIVALLAAEHVELEARETGELLVRALADSDPRVVDVAFEGLCDAPVAPWLADLHRRWVGFDAPRRIAALEELPRDEAPTPFRADLIALLDEREHTAQALELLAAFAPDAELARIARRELQEVLAELDGADQVVLELERRASALVRAVHVQSAGADVAAQLDALRRVGRRDVEIGKLCVWSLGQSLEGRAELDAWLAPEVPSRLRIEAELMLAPLGREDAVAGLERDFASCDSELRSRALRAAAASNTARGQAFVRRLMLDERANDALRQLAVDVLAAHSPPDVEALIAASQSRNLELRSHATLALGRKDWPRAVEHLRERAAALAHADLGSEEARTRHEVEREALLTALASAEALDDALVAGWLDAPLDAARGQLEARFRGDPQSNAEFAWRVELTLGATLARSRSMLAALARNGAWWTLDARLAAALAERASAEGDHLAARELDRLALIGLEGEGESDDRWMRVFESRQRLLHTCETLRDWSSFACIARELLDERRALRGPVAAFERAFGGFDPARGEDGLARLESALEQALAWRDLDAGDVLAARSHAELAARACGASSAAQGAQRKLDAALAAREGE